MNPLGFFAKIKDYLALGIMAGLLIALVITSIDARQWRKIAKNEATSHSQTKTDYARAQAEAKALDAARMATTLAKQASINQETSRAYQIRLTDLRSRYDVLARVRGNDQATRSTRTGPPVPAISDGTRRFDGATGEDRFSPDARNTNGLDTGGELTLTDALIASETALRLEALQSWVTAQTAIDPNQAPPAP